MSSDDRLLPGADVLFDDVPCGLVITEEHGAILRCNRTFCTWIGRDASWLLGRRFQDLLTVGGRIFHQAHWAQQLRIQGSVAEVKFDLIHHDGHAVTMLLNGVRREHADGVYCELALFSTVERVRHERELLDARERAEQLLSEKIATQEALQEAKAELAMAYQTAERRASFAEQMVAIASHDLKNPLTAVKMAAQLLGRGERTDRDRQLLDRIGIASQRAERMVADLLDFTSARIGQGISVRTRACDLQELVGQSVEELRVAFSQARIRHLSRGQGLVELDPDRIQQMIGNLVANSVAYGELNHPITLTTEVTDGALVIAVHNHGPAIAETYMPHLFEPMTRGSDRDETIRSVGLGLFIVREIVSAHGGDISVRSNERTGTVFTVRMVREVVAGCSTCLYQR